MSPLAFLTCLAKLSLPAGNLTYGKINWGFFLLALGGGLGGVLSDNLYWDWDFGGVLAGILL